MVFLYRKNLTCGDEILLYVLELAIEVIKFGFFFCLCLFGEFFFVEVVEEEFSSLEAVVALCNDCFFFFFFFVHQD